MPRFGTNCYWCRPESFGEYAELVDVFKYSGRLRTLDIDPNDTPQAGWVSEKRFFAGSFSEIINHHLEPIHLWQFGIGAPNRLETRADVIKEHMGQNAWMSEEGQRLEKRLKNCKNQCYQCHLCERANHCRDIDSTLEL
jgi:hypothetical protein